MTNLVKNYEEVNLYDFSSYETVKEMDQAGHEMNKVLNAKEYELLNYFRQKSATRHIGVVCRLHQTIANDLNKSVATVKRYLKRLVNKGVLIVENGVRPKKKGYGACIYIIPSLAYFKTTYKEYVKKQNELGVLSYRKEQKERRQSLESQSIAYVSRKNSTMNYLIYSNKSLSTTSTPDNTNEKLSSRERQQNIKHAKIKPMELPNELWQQFKPFFTENQLSRLYKVMLSEMKDFTHGVNALDYYEQIEVMTHALNSLVKALRREHKGGNKVNNIFAYAKAVAYSIAFNLSEYDTIDDFIEPVKTDFQLSMV